MIGFTDNIKVQIEQSADINKFMPTLQKIHKSNCVFLQSKCDRDAEVLLFRRLLMYVRYDCIRIHEKHWPVGKLIYRYADIDYLILHFSPPLESPNSRLYKEKYDDRI